MTADPADGPAPTTAPPRAAVPAAARLRGSSAAAGRAAWVRPALARPAGRHRRALPLGPGRLRLGERLLLRRRPGGLDELEGVLLRLVRRRQLDHRRQAARPRCGSMALSVRLFGLCSWSILVPQALMGVATVGVLYAAVRRVARARRPACSPGSRRADAGRRR